jgi:hypothetical protein
MRDYGQMRVIVAYGIRGGDATTRHFAPSGGWPRGIATASTRALCARRLRCAHPHRAGLVEKRLIRQDTGLAVAVAGLGLLLYGCVFTFPALFTASRERSLLRLEKDAQDYLTLENSIRGTLLQVVLGIGVLAAAVSAWTQFTGAAEQLQLTRQQFVSGQFTSATDLLSKPDLESRLGGLYTFQRLTENTKDDEMGRQDSLTAYQLLAAFIKAHSPWPPLKDLDKDQKRRRVDRFKPLELGSLRKRSPDVQLALDIVGAGNKLLPTSEEQTYSAFLTDADLRGADLGNLHLTRGDLRGPCSTMPTAGSIDAGPTRAIPI